MRFSNRWNFFRWAASPAAALFGVRRLDAAFLIVAVVPALCGCRSMARLDRAVEREIGATAVQHAMGATGIVADASAAADEAGASSVTGVTLSLSTSLELASRYSRDLQNRREQLYLDTLSLFGTRRDFGFAFAGTVQYVLNRRDSGDDEIASGRLDVSRRLPTGGTIGLSGDAAQQRNSPDAGDDTTTYASSGRLRFDQPLLAGAGYEAGYGPLIQAERDYVYAMRDFVLARQDFALGVMREYFSLLSAQRVLENTRKNVEQFTFLRQRSEALFKVSRAPAIDVLRSQQEELSAMNRLQSSQESFKIQVSRFLVSLGLPATAEATVSGVVPALHDVNVKEEEAIRTGLARRLDLLTVSDRREDAARNLRVARRGRLPELTAFGEAGVDASGASSWSDQDYEERQTAGLTLDVPLDRRDERDAVKRAALGKAAADRAWREREDGVRLEIAANFSDLRSLRTSVDIEARNIDVAEKRARNASLRFRNGELSNRDVIEAENDLLNARNAWVQALLDYELQRLQLLRNMGLLDVSEDGRLVELPFPQGARAGEGEAVPRTVLPDFEAME